MYLSRVEIDINNRRKIKDLTHAGAFHNWVESSFPEELKSGERSRKLWRIDKLNSKEYLLLVSQDKPNIEKLEKYGVEGTGQIKEYDNFLKSLKKEQQMNFRLVLNPVISKSRGSGNRSRVMPHVTSQHQIKYFLDRTIKNGFRVREEDVNIVERGYVTFKKTQGRPIKLVKAVYEGILTIEDTELFRNVLTDGIGKKKAYGFGLLTVIPVK